MSGGLGLRAGALAVVAAALLAAPSAALAVTRSVDYGQPGRAQMPAVRGRWNPNGGTLRIPSRSVGRTVESRATQTICADFTLYRFTPQFYEGAWAFDATRRWCVRAAPRHRARFPAWRFSALAYSSYSLDVAIAWRVTGGAALSRALYHYDRVGDYRCETKNCTSALRFAGIAGIRFDS
jgi:hypothetical protein